MPPQGYLTGAGIESALEHLARTYPTICQLIVMPERSHEGRTIRAVKIASRADGDRRGVLFVGGIHAREIVNPDLLVSLALNLCKAYSAGIGLTFGGRSYDSSTIRMLVDSLDIFVLPLANPDGRAYVQSPTGDAFWRKNRNPNPGLSCKGVDVNRNHDFLWSSGIGTSANSCSEVFKGSNAFSEPESRNVRHLLDDFPNIMSMIDVHSYQQVILYPWGDDDNQSINPSMNFRNPSFDGMRGKAGDSIYREYIRQTDDDWFSNTGGKMRDAIAAVRGVVYKVEPGIDLYPTSGTSHDYSYSQHFVEATKRRVFAYSVETGTEFQPPYSEALNIISEVSSGLVEFSVAIATMSREYRFYPKGKITLRASNGQYVIADRNSGLLTADSNDPNQFATFDFGIVGRIEDDILPLFSGQKVALRAAFSGQYVCAEDGGGRELIANRNALGPWETFTLVKASADAKRGDPVPSCSKIALRANNGQYVCAEDGGGRELIANRNALDLWETFTTNTGRDRNGDGTIDIRELRVRDKWVSVDPVPFREEVRMQISVVDANSSSAVPATVIIENKNLGAKSQRFPTDRIFSFTFQGRWVRNPQGEWEFLYPTITVVADCYDTKLQGLFDFANPESA